MSHVLVLGGTADARRLADALASEVRVTTSLAGRTAQPVLPAGETRIGGFGGPGGLAAWIAGHDVTAVVDATHPFAAVISASAAEACRRNGVPLARLDRPGWTPGPGDRWHPVADLTAAAREAPRLGRRVLLALGRGGLEAFAADGSTWFLMRCVDRPSGPLPERHTVLLDRGPFPLESERALLRDHAIDVVVTRDSGGHAAAAKLVAARELGIPVVVVQRPPVPDVGLVVDSVATARTWALGHSAGSTKPVGDPDSW